MNDIPTALRSLARQEQFLDVVDRDTATARFHRHLKLRPRIPLAPAGSRATRSSRDRRSSNAPGRRAVYLAPMARLPWFDSRFTEGFETTDLKAAKALVDDLDGS